MKNVSIITLLIMAASVVGYGQDSVAVQRSVTETYTASAKTKTYSSADDRQFRAFKVGVGLGFAVPGKGEGAGGGLLFFLEPAYRASDRILIGLRLESAIIVRGVEGVNNNNNDVKGKGSANASYTLNGQYYFNDNSVRPFIGAGAGLFSLAAGEFNTAANNNNVSTNKLDAKTVFGFYPRIGIDAGHFTLTLDYNILPKSNLSGGGEVINNYLGIRAGIAIGGGRIK